MRIGIVGNGVVGNATARCYLDWKDCEVRRWDIVSDRRTHTLLAVLNCDLIFMCLPSPQKQDSLECDASAIHKFFGFAPIGVDWREKNYVLRSTVPVGTTRRLREQYGLTNLVHSPEFLTARTAVEDARNPVRNIIGGVRCDCAAELHDLYYERFPGVPIFHPSSDESEFVKLMQNAHSAVKIAFFNEMHQFAISAGLDWHRCLDALLAGGWINPMHTQVPGPDGLFGFGGACLPKDLANLISCFRALDVRNNVLSAAHNRNQSDRRRV